MTSPKPAAAVDLEALRSLLQSLDAAKLADNGVVIERATLVALIAELEQLRAGAPKWKTLLDAAGQLQVDEGETYLFAIETGDGAWEYFSDSICWDADEETIPDWRNGSHGWPLNADLFFAGLLFARVPSPPEAVKP